MFKSISTFNRDQEIWYLTSIIIKCIKYMQKSKILNRFLIQTETNLIMFNKTKSVNYCNDT